MLPFFLFAAIFAATVSAQTNSCAAKVEVTRNNSDVSINGASATAVNDKTKESYKSDLKDGIPYFAELPEGKYRISVTKAGYMRSADDFYLDCNDSYDWKIELFKGSPKLLVKLYNRRIARPQGMFVVEGIPSIDIDNVSRVSKPPTTNEKDEPAPPPKPSKPISKGVVNGSAISLPKPPYPAAARAVRASGAVNVQVLIDENGGVVSASAVSGHPLLRQAAEQAARGAKFKRTLLSGQPVKVNGIIVYNFVP